MTGRLTPANQIVQNRTASIQALYEQYVVPSYGRFNLALARGEGSYVWDVDGRRYLDLGGGIAVTCLGHAHPELVRTIAEQAGQLIHVSNLYYYEIQGRLAQNIAGRLAPGKTFFCNSGAEANEGLFKLARRFGDAEGRYEILTASNSFHGRTLAGIAATGQDKVKKGFGPLTPGFRHAKFNDPEAFEDALSPSTVAILIEGIQGEGGVTPAHPDFLLGLRRLCDEKRLLLLMDGVQCGHYRTGRFQSFQRLLESHPEGGNFLPDGVAMAKSLAGGFPMGAFWTHEKHAGLLGPGSHGTTYGGNLMGCAIASKILEIIDRDRLDQNAKMRGEQILDGLGALARNYPDLVLGCRGLGLLTGFELNVKHPAFQSTERPASLQMVDLLHEAGLMTIPAGANVVRLLPPLNVPEEQIHEGLNLIESVLKKLN